MNRLFRFALAAGLLLGAPAAVLAAAPAATVPAEAFFAHQSVTDVTLSPDGRHVAMRLLRPGTTVMLAIFPVGSKEPTAMLKISSDVAWYRWISNTRLLYSLSDRPEMTNDRRQGPGLYAINLDGSGLKQLVSRVPSGHTNLNVVGEYQMPMSVRAAFVSGNEDNDVIYATWTEHDRTYGPHVRLIEVDTVTGRSAWVPTPPGRTFHWVLGPKGDPRIAMTFDDARTAMHYRQDDGSWRKLAEFDPLSPAEGLHPVGFSPDGTLYVRANKGKDKSALYPFDVATGKLGDRPLVEMEHYDFSGSLIYRGDRLAGVSFMADAPGIAWLDEDLKRLQQIVDKALPRTINRIWVPRRGRTPYMLVHTMSDTDPGAAYLLDTGNGKMELLGRRRPEIDPAAMAPRRAIRYKARDGLEIPAYLTLPKSGPDDKLPLVVLVHGGPWQRGADALWDNEAQFLASRGYAVLEPEFRGSVGYGERLFRASFRQWGLSMQDDLADGAQWAIAQGLADPGRICIAGSSYGGYAALMGVVRHPDVFRCAISRAGVTDIDRMYEFNWIYARDLPFVYGPALLIGHRDKDAALLKQASPLHHAASIKRPVLLAHGDADGVVPVEQSKSMRKALESNKAEVEYHEYEHEGHGFARVAAQVDFWTRAARFLDRHIGPAPAPAAQ